MTEVVTDTEIETLEGEYVDLLAPELDHLSIEMVAGSLSKICRYVGQCKYPYNVAQHSLLVADILRRMGAPELQLEGLLHEAPEALLGDVSTMLKRKLTEYKAIEHVFEERFAQRFGLDRSKPALTLVKRADLIALATERDILMPPTKKRWGIIEGIPRVVTTLICEADWRRDRDAFLRAYAALKRI